MTEQLAIPTSFLNDNGLNMHAVFNCSELPKSVLENLTLAFPEKCQLLMFAHGGKKFWEALKKNDIQTENPVDDFSVHLINQFFSKNFQQNKFEILYPKNDFLDLQGLGKLAGWHNTSPFKLGINSEWGSWFAYRVIVLADTQFQTTPYIGEESPCETCKEKPCISICPANAMQSVDFDITSCITYRKQDNSSCETQCISRLACPVGRSHQYSVEQIHYHYSVSLKVIKQSF